MSVYLQDTTNPEVKRLFYQKLYTRPRHKAFTNLEIGVESLRNGLNAFYTGSEAYKVMSDTYEESEKCRLKEISIIPTNLLGIPVKKGSPYREHITQKYVLLTTHENNSDLESEVGLGSERHVAVRCITVKYALGRRAVVSLACE
jgi:hypothetical protein